MNILNEPSLDFDSIAILKEATEEMFNEIIEVYLNDTPERLSLLREAFNSKDLKVLTEESHCIKGSSGNVGAIKLAKICEYIEKSSRDNNLTDHNEYIQYAVEEFDIVKKELEKLLD